jgi:hypothetical protein
MDLHPLIRHEPDPDHPGWWSWDVAEDERFNGMIGELLVRADGAGRATCRTDHPTRSQEGPGVPTQAVSNIASPAILV